jgi:hypothetical protein
MGGHIAAFFDRPAEWAVTSVTPLAAAPTNAMPAATGKGIPLREYFVPGLQRFDML